MPLTVPAGVEVTGRIEPGFETILTEPALALVADLHRAFSARRKELLANRAAQQARFDAGERPTFPAETQAVRDGDWKIAGTPADLQDRRTEITGPTDRKMVINALNSGAACFMADFEDANCPTWTNMIDGQINLRDANARQIAFTDPASGKDYALGDTPAVIIARPRGWHLDEAHVRVDGEPVSGTIFDLALYACHNHETLRARGSAPYFYLPKMEGYMEARLANDVIVAVQERLGLPRGTLKVTVLIEVITAAFEMDEILYELRDHIVGLNAGRWDYIFSYIKKFAKDPAFLIPDRAVVGMTQPFMRSYALLLIKTCHRRGAHAMGGMAAQIPIKNDSDANEAAFAKVRADKEREATDGHDGTWVAHPGLVSVAKEIFDTHMPQANQVSRSLDNVTVTAADLLQVPTGATTEEGLRTNLRVGVQYIEAWLRGSGCVPLYNLMEDAATAEISRAQVWQQLRHGARLDDGRPVTEDMFNAFLAEEMVPFAGQGRFDDAIELFRNLCLSEGFPEFLTLPAYEMLLAEGR